MARVVRTHNARYVDDDVPQTTEEYVGLNPVARAIYVIGGIIIGFLALRFLLALLGANPANTFANFVYSVSNFFAAPFFGLFNYHTTSGIVRFEYETLIAIAVYAFLTWALVRLLSLTDA